MARPGEGLLDGFVESGVSAGVVEHVEVRSGGEKGFCGVLGVFVFFEDDPFGVSGQGVEPQLEHAVRGDRAHGSKSVVGFGRGAVEEGWRRGGGGGETETGEVLEGKSGR